MKFKNFEKFLFFMFIYERYSLYDNNHIIGEYNSIYNKKGLLSKDFNNLLERIELFKRNLEERW